MAETCDECDSTEVVVTVQGLGACVEHIDVVMARVGALMQALRDGGIFLDGNNEPTQ
jgi:hypothetical protein